MGEEASPGVQRMQACGLELLLVYAVGRALALRERKRADGTTCRVGTPINTAHSQLQLLAIACDCSPPRDKHDWATSLSEKPASKVQAETSEPARDEHRRRDIGRFAARCEEKRPDRATAPTPRSICRELKAGQAPCSAVIRLAGLTGVIDHGIQQL